MGWRRSARRPARGARGRTSLFGRWSRGPGVVTHSGVSNRRYARSRCRLASLVPALFACAAVAGAQAPDSLPFSDGEHLTFRIHTSKLGTVGHAVMALTGPVDVRGTETMLASFDASAGIAFLKGSDATRSWIDLSRMTALRFAKHEHRPFSSSADSVEIYPGLHHWEGVNGDSGAVVSDLPLDELSFIYYLRTLTLAPDSLYTFARNYDKRRIPTTVRVVRYGPVKTPAGAFNTVEYEVRVVDQHDFSKTGVLYFWFSEDARHLPVQIESTMPFLGKSIMTLESAITPNCRCDQQ